MLDVEATGKRIRLARQMRRMNERELADAIGYSYKAVSVGMRRERPDGRRDLRAVQGARHQRRLAAGIERRVNDERKRECAPSLENRARTRA